MPIYFTISQIICRCLVYNLYIIGNFHNIKFIMLGTQTYLPLTLTSAIADTVPK